MNSNNPELNLPVMMTPAEVLGALRLTGVKHPQQTLFRLRQSGKLSGVRIGRSYLYNRAAVLRLLSGQET